MSRIAKDGSGGYEGLDRWEGSPRLLESWVNDAGVVRPIDEARSELGRNRMGCHGKREPRWLRQDWVVDPT